MAEPLVKGGRHVLQHQVQVDITGGGICLVEIIFQPNDLGMRQELHNLQFSVLEAFILKHFFDGHHLVCLADSGCKHNAERAVAHHFSSRVRDGDRLCGAWSVDLFLHYSRVSIRVHVWWRHCAEAYSSEGERGKHHGSTPPVRL